MNEFDPILKELQEIEGQLTTMITYHDQNALKFFKNYDKINQFKTIRDKLVKTLIFIKNNREEKPCN